jgi:LysR family transcriptional regulator of beta-lactamase
VALLPTVLFQRDLAQGRLVRPFDVEVSVGRYWLTRLASRPPSPALASFEAWLIGNDVPTDALQAV